MKFVLLYAWLAAIATAVNIGTQEITSRLYDGPAAVLIAMFMGTGTGLVVKYLLDKRYIFHFRARDAGHDSKTFALYTLMGLATTAIFWGFELGFEYAFADRTMRYVGAVLGLSIGYVAKYYLDKRFVFRQAPASAGSATIPS